VAADSPVDEHDVGGAAGAASPWRVAAASVVGTGHVAHGQPCQDAHAYRAMADGVLLVAVADGAGSAARAEDGARVAVASALEALAAVVEAAGGSAADNTGGVDWSDRMTAVFQAVRAALEELANVEWEPLRAFACTLTCALATHRRLVVGQVGDGVAVGRGSDGSLFAASQPQKGEYANEARFVTMADALDHVETRVFDGPLDAVAITTDGLLRLALVLPTHEPHAPFSPLLDFVGQTAEVEQANARLAAFLASERICARTDDDKTLVIAVHAPVDAIAAGDPAAGGGSSAHEAADELAGGSVAP